MDVQLSAAVGNLAVRTTSGRGRTPEELAEEALAKIIYVGDHAHPTIREQAHTFREQLRHVLVYYMQQAVVSDRTTLAAKFKAHGHADLVALLEQ